MPGPINVYFCPYNENGHKKVLRPSESNAKFYRELPAQVLSHANELFTDIR
jgi:hypothetical protein